MEDKEKNPQNYFVTDIDTQDFEDESLSEKMRPVQDTAQKGLVKIWPTINRGINTFLYYAFKIVRSAIHIAISQLK